MALTAQPLQQLFQAGRRFQVQLTAQLYAAVGGLCGDRNFDTAAGTRQLTGVLAHRLIHPHTPPGGS
jgi:hypothetical protein